MPVVPLDFPLGGLNRRFAFGQQPRGTTPDCLNVRPTCTFGQRQRGGSRPGLVKAYDSAAGTGPVQAMAGVSKVTNGVVSRILVTISGGVIKQDATGDLAVTTTPLVTCNPALTNIQCAERGQKLYIADWGPERVSGTDGVITTATKLLSAASVPDWTIKGINVNTDVVTVHKVASPGTPYSTWPIESVAAGGLTLLAPDGAPADNPTGITFSVQRGVKIYDPETNAVTLLTTTLGLVPLGCPSISIFRDRLCLAGPNHIWWLSRQGDFTDYHYGTDPGDPGRAISHTLSFSASPGKPIAAVIPHDNDSQIFACEDELWVMHGDPTYGGALSKIAPVHGIIAPLAWCNLPDFGLVFLSQDGLSLISGGATTAIPFSQTFVPLALHNVDPSTNAIALAYDPKHRGIQVSVTPTAGTAGEHWWIQWPDPTQPPSLWPEAYPGGQQPTCMLTFDRGIGYDRQVLLGSYDGYIRTHSDTATTDDSSQLTSYVYYGPYRLGGDEYRYGMLAELIGTLEASGYPVAWSIYAGDTAQDAVKELEPIASGMWRPGWNPSTHPRIRAGAACLKLSAIGQWAPEGIAAVIAPKGNQR